MSAAAPESPGPEHGVVATVGHGRLELNSLVDLVAAAGVAELVDVRRTPFSRRNPQFNRERLAAALADAGVRYRWEEALGGRREAAADSPNVAVPSELRGYADYLATPEGAQARAQLAERARTEPIAVMCAEGDWRRCHRRLLADAITVVDGLAVVHLAHDATRTPHRVDPHVRNDTGTPRWDRGADRPLEP